MRTSIASKGCHSGGRNRERAAEMSKGKFGLSAAGKRMKRLAPKS